MARRELTRLGYRILEANYRTRRGEIDLIAREGGELVFVEVRSKRGGRWGSAAESITPAKRSRLVAVAQAYLQERGMEAAGWRIDVLVIDHSPRGAPPRIEVIRNAVGEEEG